MRYFSYSYIKPLILRSWPELGNTIKVWIKSLVNSDRTSSDWPTPKGTSNILLNLRYYSTQTKSSSSRSFFVTRSFLQRPLSPFVISSACAALCMMLRYVWQCLALFAEVKLQVSTMRPLRTNVSRSTLTMTVIDPANRFRDVWRGTHWLKPVWPFLIVLHHNYYLPS